MADEMEVEEIVWKQSAKVASLNFTLLNINKNYERAF